MGVCVYIGPSFLPRASLAEAKPTRAALAAAPVQGSKPQKLHTSQPCTPAHLPPREICPRNRSERTWDRLEAVQQLPAFDCRAPLPRFFFCCACIINRLCLTKSGHSCEVCAPQLVNMPLPTSLDTFLRSMDMLRSSIYVAKAPEPRLPPRQGQFFRMPLASPPNLGQSLVHCCEVRSACFCHVRRP